MTDLIETREARRVRACLGVGPSVRPAIPVERARPDRWLLSGRAARLGARARLEAELRTIAADVLGPTDADELPSSCAEWITTTVEDVVSRASDAALETLVHGLERSLVNLPPDVARWLRRARTRQETGVF